jgi:hypothetical protein
MTTIAQELKKVRADPDYLPPICLRCGDTFDEWPETELGRLLSYDAVLRVDACEILCEDCVDAEIIEQAKALGEWNEAEFEEN